MVNKVTLKAYLHSVFERAYSTDDKGKKTVINRALKNFLGEHDLVGTRRGVPVWRRNPNYFNRGKKSYGA